MTRVTREIGDAENRSNVLPFQAASEDTRTLRQQAIREHLMSLACRDRSESAIASAFAILQEDGTIEISAKGIDPEVAIPMADALDQLSAAVRWHAVKPTRKSRERGVAKMSLFVTAGFMAATFINQIAWLDAALMLAAQLVVTRLVLREPPIKQSPGA